MSLLFYYAPRSTAVVTAAVLDELEYGLPNPLAKRIELSLKAGDTRTSHYLATINPNGRVPAIVHDSVSIWESAAITMYLGETFGVVGSSDHRKQSLYPASGLQRGEAMKWIVWGNTTLVAPAARLAALLRAGAPAAVEPGSQDFDPQVNRPNPGEAEAQAKAVVTAKNDIMKSLDVLNGALNGREFLLQDYSLVDTHIWCFVSYISLLGISLESYTNVKDWAAKIKARPALDREQGYY